jgi:CelD/BcsL family acetyltransferase involved in cellulose biosynthesis
MSAATNLASLNIAERDSSIVAAGATVRVVRSLEEVEQIRDIWSAWKGHRDSDIDYCLRFVWARDEVVRPHVLVLSRAGQPEAMLIGRLEHTRMRSRIGYFRLPGIAARLLNFSYGGFLGNASQENSEELFASIMASMRVGEADMALLDHLGTESFLYKAATSEPRFTTRDHFIKAEPHCVMNLASTVEEVYRAFSQGLRAEVKRKKKKIIGDFGAGVEIRCYRRIDELDGAVPLLEAIAKTTYQRGLGVGFQDTEQMRQRLRICAEKGWLRVYLLSLAGEPRAFWMGTLHNAVFCSDYNGYDPGFREYSLGTFLLAHMIEDFCKENVRSIDFGFGGAEYKDRFSNCRFDEASVHIFAPHTKGLLLNGVRTATGIADNAARNALARTNLLPRIKKLWRKRAAQHAV